MSSAGGNMERVLRLMAEKNASDVYLSANSPILIKINGQLLQLSDQPLTHAQPRQLLAELLTPTQLEELEDSGELNMSVGIAGVGSFRLSAFRQRGSIAAVFRCIPVVIPSLESLNVPTILNNPILEKRGLILMVGATGTGKSTTLAAMLEQRNQQLAGHILTIEDPIEYVYTEEKALIDQREVGIDTKNFESALTAALRQDVDVILVGEMRNPETIAAAVTAAETGHLVYSTLHTNDAAQTINRIVDSFPGNQQDQIRVQLAGSLIAIFSQRLLPHTGGGLVPAYELLINNAAVSNLIRENRIHEIPSVIETGLEQGMIDLNRSLARLVQNGDITVEDAFRHSSNPKGLERLI